MTSMSSIRDRIRTAMFLLIVVLPLTLQSGSVAGEDFASRQVNRLLEDLDGDGDISSELALQCMLIPLVSNAVTLRAVDMAPDHTGASNAGVSVAPFRFQFGSEAALITAGNAPFRANRIQSQERPQGP